jgi:integrase
MASEPNGTRPSVPAPAARGGWVADWRLTPARDGADFPNPTFAEYWPRVAAYLRHTTQDTGNVENYLVCWREVEKIQDEFFGRLGDLPLRAWTRPTAVRILRQLAAKADGSPRARGTLEGKVNALAAVFRRAALDQHPLTDEPLFSRPNPFRAKTALLKEVFGHRELRRRAASAEVRPYDREEIAKLLAFTRRRSWADYLVLLLCVRCGLRRSEAIALRWEAFNARARTLSVRRKASKPRNQRTVVSDEFKTANSRRTVPVPIDAWCEIELWREHCIRQAKQGGSPYSRYVQPSRRRSAGAPSPYLFPPRKPSLTGAPVLDPDAWAHRLKRDLVAAGIDVSARRHFAHHLRHTYASELLARGADIAQVAKLLGDTIAVAEECYAHLVQNRRLQQLTDSLIEDN